MKERLDKILASQNIGSSKRRRIAHTERGDYGKWSCGEEI